MYAMLIRKIESFFYEIYLYASADFWDNALSERMITLQEEIEYTIKLYPRVVSELFDDIVSLKTEMDALEDSSLLEEIESHIEELISLIKKYECTPRTLMSDDHPVSGYCTIFSNDVATYEYQDYLNESFVSLSKARLSADAECAESIYCFIVNADNIVTKERIIREFPTASTRAINIALNRDDVLNFDSAYIAANNLHINDLSRQRMLHTMHRFTEDGFQHNVSELYEYAQIHNTDFLSQARTSTAHQLYSVIEFFCADDFSFARPYFAAIGVPILTAEEQLRQQLMTSRNYSIAVLLEYAKTKKIKIYNIAQTLLALNDSFYILDKEHLIPIAETAITTHIQKELTNIVSRELTHRRCVAIRDLEIWPLLPRISMPWTEWLVYSVLNKINLPSISVCLSSNKFKQAIPIVAMIGEDTVENIKAASAHHSYDESAYDVDNLDDLDLLLESIIDIDILGEDV